MQTKKMSLANIQGKLSRAEMKKIMAGSEPKKCGEDGDSCDSDYCCAGITCLDATLKCKKV